MANDKNALWLALRELHAPGERLIGVPVFLRRLVEGGLPIDAADDVLGECGTPTPTWWRDFSANARRPPA